MKSVTTIFESNGAYDIFEVILEEAKVIQNIPCKAGKILVFEDGNLHRACLAKAFALGSWIFPENSEIYLRNNGKIAEVNCNEKFCKEIFSNLKFDPQERIRSVTTARPTDLNGIPCVPGNEILLYPDGSIKNCEVAIEVKINETLIHQGSRITLDPKGNIIG